MLGTTTSQGITWTGTEVLVVDSDDDVYRYQSDGTYLGTLVAEHREHCSRAIESPGLARKCWWWTTAATTPTATSLTARTWGSWSLEHREHQRRQESPGPARRSAWWWTAGHNQIRLVYRYVFFVTSGIQAQTAQYAPYSLGAITPTGTTLADDEPLGTGTGGWDTVNVSGFTGGAGGHRVPYSGGLLHRELS